MIREVDPTPTKKDSEYTNQDNRTSIQVQEKPAEEERSRISVDESTAIPYGAKEWNDGY